MRDLFIPVSVILKTMKPGEEIIVEGIKDLSERKETIYSLLVSIDEPRLRRIGIPVLELMKANIHK